MSPGSASSLLLSDPSPSLDVWEWDVIRIGDANMSTTWLVKVGYQHQGPLTSSELEQWAACGRIGPDTLVREAHGEQWVAARSLPNLRWDEDDLRVEMAPGMSETSPGASSLADAKLIGRGSQIQGCNCGWIYRGSDGRLPLRCPVCGRVLDDPAAGNVEPSVGNCDPQNPRQEELAMLAAELLQIKKATIGQHVDVLGKERLVAQAKRRVRAERPMSFLGKSVIAIGVGALTGIPALGVAAGASAGSGAGGHAEAMEGLSEFQSQAQQSKRLLRTLLRRQWALESVSAGNGFCVRIVQRYGARLPLLVFLAGGSLLALIVSLASVVLGFTVGASGIVATCWLSRRWLRPLVVAMNDYPRVCPPPDDAFVHHWAYPLTWLVYLGLSVGFLSLIVFIAFKRLPPL